MNKLHKAIEGYDVGAVETLLGQGVSPCEEDGNGLSAFTLALALGRRDMIKMFLDHLGYDPVFPLPGPDPFAPTAEEIAKFQSASVALPTAMKLSKKKR